MSLINDALKKAQSAAGSQPAGLSRLPPPAPTPPGHHPRPAVIVLVCSATLVLMLLGVSIVWRVWQSSAQPQPAAVQTQATTTDTAALTTQAATLSPLTNPAADGPPVTPLPATASSATPTPDTPPITTKGSGEMPHHLVLDPPSTLASNTADPSPQAAASATGQAASTTADSGVLADNSAPTRHEVSELPATPAISGPGEIPHLGDAQRAVIAVPQPGVAAGAGATPDPRAAAWVAAIELRALLPNSGRVTISHPDAGWTRNFRTGDPVEDASGLVVDEIDAGGVWFRDGQGARYRKRW
jgi:hypothetical protein